MADFETQFRDFETLVTERYYSGDPLVLPLDGVHPDFFVESLGQPYPINYREYRTGSPYLSGEYPIRHVAALGNVDRSRVDAPVVLIDGIGDHSRRVFGFRAGPLVLNSVAELVQSPLRMQ